MVLAYSSTTSFWAQALSGRWFTVYGTVLIMAISGPTYMFAAYSEVIKSSLGYTQTTLNMISFFKDVGSTFGVPSGLLMEVIPPWAVLATGGLLNFFGYFMMWLAVTHRIAKPAVWHMCLYIALSANSTAFSSTATLVPCVINFPEGRGVTLGIMKGFSSLSSAIITQLYSAIFYQNPKELILFLAFLPAAISIAFIRTIRIINTTEIPDTKDDAKIFYQILYMSLGLAGFLFSIIIFETHQDFSQRAYVGSAIIVVALLCLPLYVVFKQEFKIWKMRQQEHEPSHVSIVTEISVTTPTIKVDRWYENVFQPPERGEDHTILQALFRFDMIIFFIGTICGLGGTWTAIDNLSQIGTSLGYPDKSITTFVSLVSIWSYLGRVVSGYMSEYLVSKYKLPRPLTITILQLLSCVGHLLIAFGVPNGLYVASVIIGFCYGAFWPVLLAIISEIFGLKYYSTLFNVGPMASPLGAYLLNVKLTGVLYDREARRQLDELGMTRKVGEKLKCEGVGCFRPAFLIITAVTAMATLLSLVNVVRAREFYRGDVYKRFRKVDKATEMVNGDGVVVVVEGMKGGDSKEMSLS